MTALQVPCAQDDRYYPINKENKTLEAKGVSEVTDQQRQADPGSFCPITQFSQLIYLKKIRLYNFPKNMMLGYICVWIPQWHPFKFLGRCCSFASRWNGCDYVGAGTALVLKIPSPRPSSPAITAAETSWVCLGISRRILTLGKLMNPTSHEKAQLSGIFPLPWSNRSRAFWLCTTAGV